MVTTTVEPGAAPEVAALVERAQAGDGASLEDLLRQFRPLLRSRMYQTWSALQAHLPGLEWADVEAQVQLLFLTRLQAFRPGDGVYFPHYMARMLEVDCRAWLREQRRGLAVPFSQLTTPAEEGADLESWLLRDTEECASTQLEQAMSLREAMASLTPAQREVVWECCVRGRTESETAERLNLSRSAVRNRLSGALARLRGFFEEHDGADGLNGAAPALTSRTGRATTQSRAAGRDFWSWQLNLTKDEKRPDLVGVGAGRPVLLQGVFEFEATGLRNPQLLSAKLSYTVPPGCVVGIRYFRAGVSCDQMVCLSTVVNGLPHRLVPIAANSAEHISFAIVEPIIAGSQIEVHIAADAPGTAIIDVGCLQMPA